MKFKKIFFSYSRTDSAFAVKLALDLKKAGFDVWIDQEDIRAGSEWDLQIENALTTCDCLLFIQSEKSVASTNVLDEVYYALEENKRVIPLIICNCKSPFRINRLQHINFLDNYEAGLSDLKDNLSGAALPELRSGDDITVKKPANVFNKKYLLILLLIVIASLILIYFSNKKPQADQQTVAKSTELPADFTGQWALENIEPITSQKNGYLKIEDAGEGKVNLKSSFQFYYAKTNDTAFLSVFNGFVECTSCILKNEMNITDKQIDIGSQKYTILKENTSEGKRGDTISSAGSNNAIRASVSLHLLNKDSIIIKVVQPDTLTISHGILVPPFDYSFLFKKEL